MSKNTTARLAGLTYFVLVLTGIFYLVYAPGQFVVWSDAAATVDNILNAEFLYRLWVFVGIISNIAFLILPFILYKLFESVNKTAATFMVILSVVSIPFSLAYTIHLLDILTLLSGKEYLAALDAQQIHTQVMLELRSYVNGMAIVKVFWGLWLFPFGYLAFKSNFLAKILGIALMLGCFSYLIKFSGGILFPAWDIPSFVGYPSSFGEIGICLWLLIMGVKEERVDQQS
ncbi:DUF4386 domain-containing protein [Aliiglaciecola sp.]|nr:DUF4386 domain-containing protein [Aliiglaciecola sp.]